MHWFDSHLGDIRDQAAEAEQSLRHSLQAGARVLVHTLVCGKGAGDANPAGRMEGLAGGPGQPGGPLPHHPPPERHSQ